jgi:electron transfer flavoprotein beta subunit
MKIAVCVKLVPATTADIRVASDGKSLQLAGVEMVVSPYDEYALEAALKTREAHAGSTIQVLTVGGDDAVKCMQHAFSVGADSGVHIKEGGLDARGAAKAVAAALKGAPPDLVLCGRQAIDDDQWLFPGMLAELLGMPHITAASALLISDDGTAASCRRRFDDGEQTIAVTLPALISCDKGMNEPRVPTLKGRLDAKKKQPVVKSASDLGLSAADVAPALAVSNYSPPPQKTPGKVITSEPAQAAAELVKLLREEAKII